MKKVCIGIIIAILFAGFCACGNNVPRITFETNGGSPVAAVDAALIETEPETVKDGYDFCGWFTTPQFTSPRLTFPYSFSGNAVTLYAKWERNPDAAKNDLLQFIRANGESVSENFFSLPTYAFEEETQAHASATETYLTYTESNGMFSLSALYAELSGNEYTYVSAGIYFYFNGLENFVTQSVPVTNCVDYYYYENDSFTPRGKNQYRLNGLSVGEGALNASLEIEYGYVNYGNTAAHETEILQELLRLAYEKANELLKEIDVTIR